MSEKYRVLLLWLGGALGCLSLTLSNAGPIEDWTAMRSIVPRGYVCYRASSPIHTDGKLDEAGWRLAPWTDDFQDIEGDRKPKPRFRTRAKMLWDDQFFYIGAELTEPHVSGTLTQRDSVIFQDNDFEIFIDPNGDNHEYYEIEINALNTVWDLFLGKPYRDGGPAVNEWNIDGLKTGVSVDGTVNDPADKDHGWSVEFALPWKALSQYAHLPTPPRDGDQWRANFSRVEWQHEVVRGHYQKVAGTKEDNWVWSPQGIIDMHRPEKWGYVQFSTGPAGQTKFRPDPTAAARDSLHQVYYAQRAFHENRGRYAQSVGELRSFVQSPGWDWSEKLRIDATAGGYQADYDRADREVHPSRLSIRQDSLVQLE